MALSKSEIAILQILMTADQYHSSYEIASLTGINSCMVEKLIPYMKTYLQEYGAKIQFKTDKGYRISIKDPVVEAKLKTKLEQDSKYPSLIPNGLLNRHILIMCRLIQNNDYLHIDNLTNEMMNQYSIDSLIEDISQLFEKYDLTLDRKPHAKLYVQGEETAKRHALNDFYFKALWDAHMLYDWLDALISDKQSWEYEILAILKQEDIYFTDISLCDLLLGISVQIERIQRGLVLEKDMDVIELRETGELAAAYQISELFKQKEICQMNEREISALAVTCACRRSLQSFSIYDPKADSLTEMIIQKTKEITGVDYNWSFWQEDLYHGTAHLLRQIRYNEKLRTEMWDDAFERFPLAYVHTQITCDLLQQEMGITLGISQKVYLTELFQHMMDTIFKNKLFVLFICASTDMNQDTYARTLQNAFDEIFVIHDVIRYYQLPEVDFNQYDLIISTIEIHKELPLPHICISSRFSKQDFNLVERFIHQHFTLTIPELYLHPWMYHQKTDIHTIQAAFTIIHRDIEKVYQKSIPVSEFTLKNVKTEWYGTTLVLEALHQQQVLSPWIVMNVDDFIWEDQPIKRILFFFGDPSVWAYGDVKKLLIREGPDLPYAEFVELLRAS